MTAAGNTPSTVLSGLHAKCSAALEQSTSAAHHVALGESYVFIGDIESWRTAISLHAESQLLDIAGAEYLTALLNLCQAQYRNAFKGLRLALELCMQCVYLSGDLVLREEWLSGRADTVWANLVDEDNGVLGVRYCHAFFPDLRQHIPHFRTLTRTLYRELSECIHGNVPNHIPLPSGLAFSQTTFDTWNEKARSVRLVVHFALSIRYLRYLSSLHLGALSPVLSQELGHIQAIRQELDRENGNE